jgi:hypothetical protein
MCSINYKQGLFRLITSDAVFIIFGTEVRIKSQFIVAVVGPFPISTVLAISGLPRSIRLSSCRIITSYYLRLLWKVIRGAKQTV